MIFSSTELEELLELGDVIITMREARMVAQYEGGVDGTVLSARHDPWSSPRHDDSQ